MDFLLVRLVVLASIPFVSVIFLHTFLVVIMN